MCDSDPDVSLPVPVGGDGGCYDNQSDSDEGDTEADDGAAPSSMRVSVPLDDWIHFKVDAESAQRVLMLRQKWHSLFIRRMRSPSKPLSQSDEVSDVTTWHSLYP